MANMVDYLAWRGDIPFEVSPWNEIDGLLIATLSYLNFHGGRDPRGWTLEEMARIDLVQEGNSSSFANRKKAFEAMAAGERFRDCRLHHAIALTDAEIGMQFSALCLDLPDGTTCVAFRGTDNTLIGWREDFDMAYTTRVPAQEAAILYLGRAAALSKRPLRLVGHAGRTVRQVQAQGGKLHPELRVRQGNRVVQPARAEARACRHALKRLFPAGKAVGRAFLQQVDPGHFLQGPALGVAPAVEIQITEGGNQQTVDLVPWRGLKGNVPPPGKIVQHVRHVISSFLPLNASFLPILPG